MFRRTLIAVVCLTPILVTSGAAQSMKISTVEEFNREVVGRSLAHPQGGQVVINASGQITGTIRGEKIVASKWLWDQSKFCRAMKTNSHDFPSECQDVVINGNTVTFGQTTWNIQ